MLLCTAFSSSRPESTKTIILQPADSRVSTEILERSAQIIAARLDSFGIAATTTLIPGKDQISVELPDNADVSELQGLLTSKGVLGFYEMLTLKEIGTLAKNVPVPDILKTGEKTSPSEAKLGCSPNEDPAITTTVRNFLKSIGLLQDYKLVWALKNSKQETCLYAIRTGGTATPPLVRSDIETISSSQDKETQSPMINIRFKAAAARTWTLMTANNLNKPVAVVIDDNVYYTPVVKTAMEGGLCQITGDFTAKDVNYFLSLVNNDPLPVSFKLK